MLPSASLSPRPINSLHALRAALFSGRLVAQSHASQSFPTHSRHFAMATAYSTPFRLRRTCPPGTRIASVRRYSRGSVHEYPRKDAQGKDDLSPRSTEYSQSGGDDTAAATSKTAFDPNNTSPEGQQKSAEKESGEGKGRSGVNPLNVSPGNEEVNQTKEGQSVEGSTAESDGHSERKRTSGGGSPQKSGVGKYGG